MDGRKQNEKTIDWSNPAELDEVISAISRCEKFRDEGGAVEVVHTHISTVLLTPGYVFEFKRAVDAGFVDFSSLKKRLFYCKEELRLNRRLARGVYLEVLPLWFQGGEYQFEPGGTIIDYAVVMKRLETGRRMDRLAGAGTLAPRDLDALAELLAQFHRSAPHGANLAHFGGLEMLTRNWEETLGRAGPYINFSIKADDYRELQHAVFAFLTHNRALLRQRARHGYIRDGHGDLRCQHIYMTPKIKIIACIEFSDRFRIGDVAGDIAILLLDLAALGRSDLSRRLLEKYIELTEDRQLARLVPFYACYHAFVRGTVLSSKLSGKHLPEAEQHRMLNRARSFFFLAREFAAQMAPPMMVLMAGLPGTGKSTLGEAIAREKGLALFSSRRIREELTGAAACGERELPSTNRPYGEGIFSESWNLLTYSALLARAAEELRRGRSVILDASFPLRHLRQAAFETALMCGVKALLVECRLPEASALERLAKRERTGERTGGDTGEDTGEDTRKRLGEGRGEIYPRQKPIFEPIDELAPENHLVIQTDQPLDALTEKVFSHPHLNLPAKAFTGAMEQIGAAAMEG